MNTALKSLCAAALAGGALAAFMPPELATAAQALRAAAQSDGHALTVRVLNPSSDAGEIWVGLYASEAAYDAGDEIVSATIPAGEETLEAVFSDLPAGDYGVIAFHDSNANGDFDRNFIGIPAERYGFSNNPRPRFRAASWEEARFTLAEDGASEMTIQLMGAAG
jgi:uncharacterized protein (DUF2141 family)